MTDPIPSDEQLDRIARRVRERIDARGRLLRQAVASFVVVALVAGGIGLLAPLLHSVGSSSSGSAAGSSSSRQSAPRIARCHTTSAAGSSSVAAPLRGGPSAADARTACIAALAAAADGASTAGAASPSTSQATLPRRLIVCRAGEVLEVFPADDDPQGLCARNGLRQVAGGVVPLPVGTPVR